MFPGIKYTTLEWVPKLYERVKTEAKVFVYLLYYIVHFLFKIYIEIYNGTFPNLLESTS